MELMAKFIFVIYYLCQVLISYKFVCVYVCMYMCMYIYVYVCKNASDDKWTMWTEASVACDWMESGTESFLVKTRFTSIVGQDMLNTRQAS